MNKKSAIRILPIGLLFLTSLLPGCVKYTVNSVNKPAYVRIFNDLIYTVDINSRDKPLPFLTFLYDPVFDASGTATGAAVIGDFLDKRVPFAPPYPAHAGNTGITANVEYPGSEDVLTGPIVNGFDLSSWAQMPSGKHRLQFYSRLISSTPFFSLDPTNRRNLLVDTVLDFQQGEVYTLEVINPDAGNQKIGLYIRQENFTKTAFSDQTVYANFYNLSSRNNLVSRDTLNAYLSVLSPDTTSRLVSVIFYPVPLAATDPSYNQVFVTPVIRSFDPAPLPFIPLFPLFNKPGRADSAASHMEILDFYSPGYSGANPTLVGPDHLVLLCSQFYYSQPFLLSQFTFPRAASDPYGYINFLEPNLIISGPSGTVANQVFGSLNSIELINGNVYMIQVQHKFPPPVLH